MAKLLIEATEWNAIAMQNTKGNTFLHMAAARGNKLFIEYALNAMYELDSPPEDIAHVLNLGNGVGKSVADVAVYNKPIKDLVYSWGGKHKKAPTQDWNERGMWLPQDHRWNRAYRRGVPQ